MSKSESTVLVTGAAGFIGSHLVDLLLSQGAQVIGVDNLSLGRPTNLATTQGKNFELIEVDLSDHQAIAQKLTPRLATLEIGAVWHLAANSDIPAGIADPNVDFRNTFQTTFNVLAIIRELRVPELAFASTSAIYGQLPSPISEDAGPLLPISNYGAFKLASEALISASTESFLPRASIFRFPNVVGPRATHGVIYDLLNKLKRRSDELEVLGDGSQQKPYLHVAELLDAMTFIQDHASEKLALYNIGPEDEGTSVRQIAEEVILASGLPAKIRYTGGNRGWVGDVPKFSYSIDKLKTLGWRPQSSSAQAIRRAVHEIAEETGFPCKQ